MRPTRRPSRSMRPGCAAWRGALRPLLEAVPPRLGSRAWRDRLTLLGLGAKLRLLGRADMRELLRIAGMCVQDLLEEHFESPLLKGALAFDAVLGTNLGPRSPGSVFTLLYRLAAGGGAPGSLAQPVGGLGALTEALARAATARGRRDSPRGARRASARDGRQRGGRDSGIGRETRGGLRGLERRSEDDVPPAARCGASRRRVRTPCRALAHPGHDREAASRAGPPAAVHGAGGRRAHAAGWCSLPPASRGAAFNDAKYGKFSAAPLLEVIVPTAVDPGPRAAPASMCSRPWCSMLPTGLPGDGKASGSSSSLRSCRRSRRMRRGCATRVHAAELLTPPGHRGASFASAAATGITRSWRSISSSWSARSPAQRSIARRCGDSSCAARAVIRAAASWDSPATTRRGRFWREAA